MKSEAFGRTAVVAAVGYMFVCASSQAAVIGMEWRTLSPTAFELYAEVDGPGTTVLNADLGDTSIDQLPGGVNNGLFSTGGMILESSELTIGDAAVSFARPTSITSAGDGSLFDSSWFAITGAAGEEEVVDSGTILGVLLGSFEIEPGTTMGGLGGADDDLQSRIFVGWTDGGGVQSGVFNIAEVPSPGSAAVIALAALSASRRRR